MSVRLIVNADDFGFTRDVNEGILEAHRRGILTATTLMANGDAFDHAVELANGCRSLDVGCHLVLVQGQSVADPTRSLPGTITELARNLLQRRIPVYEELLAQIRKIVRAGIRPSHIDTHKHTHLFPPVLDAVARLAQEFRIPYVRRPFDCEVDPGAGLLKSAVAVGMRIARPVFARTLRDVRTTDHFIGFQATGTMNEERLAAIITQVPPGLTELMCHPGRLGTELSSAATRLKQTREIELKALISPRISDLVRQRGVKLCSFRDCLQPKQFPNREPDRA